MRRGGSGLGLGGGSGEGGGAFKVAPGRSSPNDLESPLISPGQGHDDAAEGEKGSGSRKGSRSSRGPQRHIRIENGEFVLGRVERARVLARRGIIEKCLGKTEVTRDDVYRNNEVISSRYTLLNFLPKNLYEQLGQNTHKQARSNITLSFLWPRSSVLTLTCCSVMCFICHCCVLLLPAPHHKAANFFFLIVAALQAIPEISTTGGRPSILLPLVFVLTVTAIKDAMEDYTRHKQDSTKNQAQYDVLDKHGKEWRRTKSKRLRVGDLVKVEDGQRIPADLLLVAAGLGDGSFVFVDTRDLDGETNLKPKQVPLPFLDACQRDEHGKKLATLAISLRTEPPSGEMSSWSGDLRVGEKRDNVMLMHFLLTDSVLRNTPWAIGLVVYTGEDTRIRSNMSEQTRCTRQKESSVFQLTKKFFVAMVVVQIIGCAVAAFISGFFQRYNLDHEVFYLAPDQQPFVFAVLRFFTSVETITERRCAALSVRSCANCSVLLSSCSPHVFVQLFHHSERLDSHLFVRVPGIGSVLAGEGDRLGRENGAHHRWKALRRRGADIQAQRNARASGVRLLG
jgi:magnesium-transporting ATPase (P-type)